MKLTGGPLVQLSIGRVDAKIPDPLGGELHSPGIKKSGKLNAF